MGVFHVFKIVQMVPNRVKHHILICNCVQLCVLVNSILDIVKILFDYLSIYLYVSPCVLSNGIKYSRMDHVNFFKGCLPQILLDPFLNTLSQIYFFHLLQSPNIRQQHLLFQNILSSSIYNTRSNHLLSNPKTNTSKYGSNSL